jgi:hypothetical protein
MLTALHKLLVDDLAGIVLARLDVDGLLYDGVRSASECFACAVLQKGSATLPQIRRPTYLAGHSLGGRHDGGEGERVGARDSTPEPL